MENNIQVSQPVMLEAINKSEIDMQVATAHAYPRNEEEALTKMVKLSCMDEDTAADCFYQLKRRSYDGKENVIEGLSVRMAEIIAACWGNLRIQTRIIGNDGKTITAQGICHDLENNVAVSKEVKRRITTKSGMTYNEDMQVVTGNAACAIAYRNAVLSVVPKAVTNSVIKQVRKKLASSEIDVPTARESAIKWFSAKGVSEAQLLDYLGVINVQSIGKEQIFELRALVQAIIEGSTTIEETFFEPANQKKMAEKAKAAADEARARAVESMNKAKK